MAAKVWNSWVRPRFSARARKTAREARALPIPTSEYGFKPARASAATRAGFPLPAFAARRADFQGEKQEDK
jgi:hypothetical protein